MVGVNDMTTEKEPVKQLPKCYGGPDLICVGTCALEPACSNHWLFTHEKMP